jgi:CubicO group peptidase (beta-lactamase class C family)
MKRRDLLVGGSAFLAAAALSACRRSRNEVLPRARVKPVRAGLEREIAAGVFPGCVWLVARGEDVVIDAAGVSAIGGNRPMTRDTIFRIASMTKPITAVAVMMLVEDGKLGLDENVERLLPELANRRVLRAISSPLDDTVPARSSITVRQLMDFTFGFGLVFDPTLPVNKAAEAHHLVLGPPVPMTPHAPDEWMRRFGELPLMYHPGERWLYNAGSLILGVLVRRASGMNFETFVEERITAPLGMRDTAFFVPPDKLERFAGCGVFTDPTTGQATRMDADGAQSAYAAPPVFPSGAGGLCSTVDDYLAFARLLQVGGEHRGRRLLRAESVRAVTTNQLSPAQRTASANSLFPGFFDVHGWGYGVRVQVAPDAIASTPGAYGWFGGFGTSWFNDPNGDRTSIVLTQSSDFLFNGGLERYRAAVYAATT